MPSNIEVRDGESFQDATGLSVMVREVDASGRVHFSVKDQETAGTKDGEMSYEAFSRRFARMDSVEEACAQMKRLGYVASRYVRIYGEEFQLLSDPFPQANRIAIRAKTKGDPSIRTIGLPVTIIQNVQNGRGALSGNPSRRRD